MKKFIIPFIASFGFCCAVEVSSIYNSVNVITGEYCESQIDFVSKDTIIQRNFTTSEGWKLNYPQNVDTDISDEACYLETPDGDTICYRHHKDKNGTFLIDAVLSPKLPYCEYHYSKKNPGKICERLLPNGRYLVNEYDEEGRVCSQYAPAGTDDTPHIVARFVYGDGYSEVHDALGHKKVYRYTGDHTLTAIESYDESLYRKERFFWNDEKQLICKSIEDSHENIDHCTTYAYDANGNCTRETLFGNLSGQNQRPIVLDSNGIPENNGVESFSQWFVYDEDGKLTQYGDDTIFNARYLYDGERLIAHLIYEDDTICMRTLFEYDGDDLVQKTIEDGSKEQRITKYSNYVKGTPGTIEEFENNQLIGRIENQFNNGQLAQQDYFSADGSHTNSTFYQYNDNNQLISTYDVGGNTTHTAYDTNSNVIAKQEDGTYLANRYDFMNRLIGCEKWEKDGRYFSELYRYDLSGNRTATVDTFGNETTFYYDAFNRPGKVIYPEVLDEEDQTYNPTIFYAYDICDRIIGIKDANGDVTRKSYNARGQVVEITHADGTKETFTYTLSGVLIEDKDLPQKAPPLTGNVQYHYNKQNDRGQNVLATSTTNDQGVTTFTLMDALGRKETVEVSNSFGQLLHQTSYRYDGNGNKVRETHTVCTPEGSSYQVVTAWEFGPNNRLNTLIEAAGSSCQQITRFSYNDKGQIAAITKPDGIQLLQEYDEMGRLLNFFASDSSFDYTYAYDEQGRITSVRNNNNNTATIRIYDDAGNLVQETLENGLCIENTFDDFGRRTELTLPDASSIAYEYDDTRLTAIHRLGYSQKALEDQSVEMIQDLGLIQYAFDEKHRCTQIHSPYWSQEISEETTIIEDPLGSETIQHSFDGQNRLVDEVSEHTNTYEYDSLSNRCSKNGDLYELNAANELLSTEDALFSYDLNGNVISKKTLHHSFEYTYDALNRLTEVIKDDATCIRFTYDAFGRRLSKQIDEEDTLQFLYDCDKEIGAVKNDHIQELRISSAAFELNDAVYAPLFDHKGSLRALVNTDTKSVAEFYRYSAFGEEEIYDSSCEQLAESAINNPWRYQGMRVDEETGLIYFGHRYYDPSVGRWTTKDPLYFLDGPNRYTFVHNNPLLYKDMNGLFSISEACEYLYSGLAYICNTLLDWNRQGCQKMKEELQKLDLIRSSVDVWSKYLAGRFFVQLTGYHQHEAEAGVYGNGNLNENVRITWINGILNLHSTLMNTVQFISDTHGGNDVHYVFRPTEGWGRDLISSSASICGFTSTHAERLADTWKDLLEEMGEEGLIIHYAHSIGGTETYWALNLLTPEERKKIRVITFGSATVISTDLGVESALNHLSRRDFVAYPYLFINSCCINFIGSHYEGWPLIDHTMHTYAHILDELGRDFQRSYGATNQNLPLELNP